MLKEIAGTRAYNILKKRKMETVEDVCQLFPSKYYDFSFINPLNTGRLDKNYAFVCKLVSYELKKQSSLYIVRCTLQDIYTQNELCVSWFGTTEMYNVLKKDYRPGDTCFIGGKLKASNKKNLFFMSNPIIFKKYDGESDCHIYTAYEKIRGISESNFERIINDCLEHATIPDKVPRELLHKYNLMSKDEAIREMHKPSSVEGVKKAKYRLNIDDLLYFALQLEEKKRNLPAGSVYGIHSLAITTKIIKNLPFQLTKDQKSAYEELVNRIRSGKRLNALIQGDVGCGKTILAFLLMFVMADNGFQSVLLAPTQVLASQHYNELKEMAAQYNIDVVYIANGLKKKEREAILKSIEDGSALMIVGTHSVLSKEVKFHDLGLSITDEEHRFGVLQREEITTKEQIKSILWTLRWVIAILILFLGFMFVTKILLPGYNESVTDKSPIVSIQAKNDNDYKRTDEIRPDDFVVTAKHKNGKTSTVNVSDYIISRKHVERVGKSTSIDIKLKNEKDVSCTVKVKNHREPIIRFNCGNPDLKAVKATLYDNGELCFEGKGDVLQFENFPWLDSYDQQDDYPILSVTFEDGVIPTVMDNWFSGLETLEYVGKLPSTVESLNATFSNCTALKEGADWGQCSKLKNINEAYSGCSSMIKLPALPASVTVADGVCQDASELLEAPDMSKAANLETAISAFEGCTKLTKASISPKLKVMTSMYSKCINLKEMPEIPETVYAMDNAFAGDISLTKLSTIPVGVTTIDSCFSDCKKIEGNITINATPSSYNSCFNNAAVATKVNIVGQCKNAVLIATTATNNNILVNGKVPATGNN